MTKKQIINAKLRSIATALSMLRRGVFLRCQECWTRKNAKRVSFPRMQSLAISWSDAIPFSNEFSEYETKRALLESQVRNLYIDIFACCKDDMMTDIVLKMLFEIFGDFLKTASAQEQYRRILLKEEKVIRNLLSRYDGKRVEAVETAKEMGDILLRLKRKLTNEAG